MITLVFVLNIFGQQEKKRGKKDTERLTTFTNTLQISQERDFWKVLLQVYNSLVEDYKVYHDC